MAPAERYRHSTAQGLSRLILLVLMSSVLVYLWRTSGGRSSPLFDSRAEPRVIAPRGDLAEDEKSTIELFRAVAPAVVYITTKTVYRRFSNLNLYRISEGTGSGFIWDDDGYIVTNFHVVRGAQTVEVTLSDYSNWKARVVGVEEAKDLAVIKIDAPKDRLQAILVGESHNLEVGQKVFAIGNPFGLDQTLTSGIISGLARTLQTEDGIKIEGLIQTDAAINPGNSGGPLLDSAGRLIGVNTAIVSPSGAFAGVGFAMPVDEVNAIVPQLIRDGKVTRPALGIRIAEDAQVRALGMQGVLVVDVLPGSAAEEAGVKPTTFDAQGRAEKFGDLIVGMEGERIRNRSDLFRLLDRHKPGDSVRITVERESGGATLTITLQNGT